MTFLERDTVTSPGLPQNPDQGYWIAQIPWSRQIKQPGPSLSYPLPWPPNQAWGLSELLVGGLSHGAQALSHPLLRASGQGQGAVGLVLAHEAPPPLDSATLVPEHLTTVMTATMTQSQGGWITTYRRQASCRPQAQGLPSGAHLGEVGGWGSVHARGACSTASQGTQRACWLPTGPRAS